MTTTQAERLLGLSERTIRRMIAAGEIKAVKTEAEGRWIIPISEICRLTGLGVVEIQGFLPTRDQVVSSASPLSPQSFGPADGQPAVAEFRPSAFGWKPPPAGREIANQASRLRRELSATNPENGDTPNSVVTVAIQNYLKSAAASDLQAVPAVVPKKKRQSLAV